MHAQYKALLLLWPICSVYSPHRCSDTQTVCSQCCWRPSLMNLMRYHDFYWCTYYPPSTCRAAGGKAVFPGTHLKTFSPLDPSGDTERFGSACRDCIISSRSDLQLWDVWQYWQQNRTPGSWAQQYWPSAGCWWDIYGFLRSTPCWLFSAGWYTAQLYYGSRKQGTTGNTDCGLFLSLFMRLAEPLIFTGSKMADASPSTPSMNSYFYKFMINLLKRFSLERKLLETRGAFIIRWSGTPHINIWHISYLMPTWLCL